jgi:iron-sulfur cluster repair protein YtfE (RIC family)
VGTVRMIESELLAHARREDDAMFPVVERVLSERALLDEMRDEHRDIHAEADRFRATLRELNKVEHPAIVAGGERLKGLVAGGTDAVALRATAAELIRQLDEHFRKEEEILFPLVREVLEPEELDEIARAMEALG